MNWTLCIIAGLGISAATSMGEYRTTSFYMGLMIFITLVIFVIGATMVSLYMYLK